MFDVITAETQRYIALFLPPIVLLKPGRGRSKIYQIKMTSDAIRDFPVTEIKLTLYGKDPLLRLCTVVAMALFLKGRSMRAWCSFYDADKPERVKSALVVSDKACGRQKIAPFITVKREQH